MKLLTEEIRATLPDLYTQEYATDPVVHVKFFTPDAGATWFIIEFDGEDTFYAFCYLGPHMADCAELGYVTLSELESLRGKLGLPVERDLYFKPKPLSEVKRELGL